MAADPVRPARPHAYACEDADRIVEEAIRGVGADVEALRVPRLLGVVLGGGYARGEGGVFADGRLSNDLDFYVVAEEGTDAAGLAGVAAALRPVSEKWTAALGVDVDFSPPKTPWRIRHDQERLMIQELVRGYCDVAGSPGEALFAGVERRPPEALPAMEAVRLLVNRGAGLLLAAESADAGFVARNLVKCVLGCGDARLILSGGYRWRAEERAAALGDDLYARAVRWKFRPGPEPVCDREAVRSLWLETVASAAGAPALRRRTLRHAARWAARRRSAGPAPLRTLGLDPLVRILRAMEPLVRERKPLPAPLRRDWEVFN